MQEQEPTQGNTDPATGIRPYPLAFTVDYPDRPLDRVTTLLRALWLIPVAILVWAITGFSMSSGPHDATGAQHAGFYLSLGGTGILFWPILLLLVFRRKYPRWLFDWNLNLSRFLARVGAYALLLRDEYPSSDEEQAVHLDFDYPDAQQLDRLLPIVKWFLAIPHFFVLAFLWIGAFFCVVIAWFAILFTGRYPRSLFDYVVGVMRWSLRVQAYAAILITDEYPPFSLS